MGTILKTSPFLLVIRHSAPRALAAAIVIKESRASSMRGNYVGYLPLECYESLIKRRPKKRGVLKNRPPKLELDHTHGIIYFI